MRRGHFHGTKGDLKVDDDFTSGYSSNIGTGTPLSRICFAATLEAVIRVTGWVRMLSSSPWAA